jgi:hypothetical protein
MPAPVHRTISLEEESVRSNYCQAHPSSDEASHLAVLLSPLGGKQAGNPLLSGLGMLVGHTINEVDHGGEVSTPLETGLLIFLLLLTCRALQDFLRLAIPVAFGISVADLNVKDGGPPLFPKAVCPNIPTGFISQHFIRVPLRRVQTPPIKDFRFRGDPCGRQGHQAQVCQLFTYVIMLLSHKTPLLAAEPVLHQKGFVASIAAFWKASRA